MTEIYHVDFTDRRLEFVEHTSEPEPKKLGKVSLRKLFGTKPKLVEDLPMPTVDGAVNLGMDAYVARVNNGTPRSTLTHEQVLELQESASQALEELAPADREEAKQIIRELTWTAAQTHKEV